MNDTPYAPFSVLFEYRSYGLTICEVRGVCIYFGAFFVLIGKTGWECLASYLFDSGKCFGVGIVVIIDGYYFEAPGEEESESGMGS